MPVIHADNKASHAVALKFGVNYIDMIELMGRPFDRYHWIMTYVANTSAVKLANEAAQ